MLLSQPRPQPRHAAIAVSVLLVQAAAPLPALAIQPTALAETTGTAGQLEWTAPLDNAALGEVTTLVRGGPAATAPPPLRARNGRTGLAVTGDASLQIEQSPKIELPHDPVGALQPLSEFMHSESQGYSGSTQDATNVTMAATQNGTTSFAYVRQ